MTSIFENLTQAGDIKAVVAECTCGKLFSASTGDGNPTIVQLREFETRIQEAVLLHKNAVKGGDHDVKIIAIPESD
jgi:hypothetical protein